MGDGLQVERALTEPPQRDAHAGIVPVGVSITCMPRCCAPAIRLSSRANFFCEYAAGLDPLKCLGFFLLLGLGA